MTKDSAYLGLTATLLIGILPDDVTFCSSFFIKSVCNSANPCNSCVISLVVVFAHVFKLVFDCAMIALNLFLVCGATITPSGAACCLKSICLNFFAEATIISLYVVTNFLATLLLYRLRSMVSLKNTSGVDIH